MRLVINRRSFLSYLLEKRFTASSSKAFALPTVLIVSIVMLMVLAVGVSATAATRDNLLAQYYDQLAQVAGDAGTAYAKACLAANGNVATWSNAAPLTPNTNCSGTPVGGYPTYVSSLNDIRSTFSVGAPTTDTNGRAVTIPNSGMTQLLRTSTQLVWKTYYQPSSQAAVVPDLCSGTATSSLGWNNAVIASSSYTIPDSQAAAISLSSSAINPGPVYFRKDFTVTTAGTYTITAAEMDPLSIYMDGKLVTPNNNSTTAASVSVNLTAGCHAITATLTNGGIIPSVSSFKLSIKLSGAGIPIVVSDTSWRVSAGNTVHYSSPNYYEDTSTWAAVRNFGAWNNTTSPWTGAPSTWYTYSGDNSAQYITTVNSASGNNYPYAQYAWFRNTRGFTMSATGDVKVSAYCDDGCAVYMDGTQVINEVSSGLVSANITIQAGKHDFGVMLYNAGSTINPSAFLLAAVKVADGTVLMRSDQNWDSSNFWSATPTEYSSYDNSFVPNPAIASTASQNVNVLVVGGGGGGAGSGSGGGGGGYVYNTSQTLSVGTYPVIIGTGGAGGGAGIGGTVNSAGLGGRDSSFLALTAYGGGYGTGHGDPNASGVGGSGGGGGIMTATTVPTAGQGTPPQGSNGGNGYLNSGWTGGTGGGGGAGGAGYPGSNISGSGNGGPGLLNTIAGTSQYFSAGGGGGEINGTYAGAGGSGVGGGSTANAAGGNASANTGSGGGGGSYGGSGTNCSSSYCGGGSGASGSVIVSYPTGSMVTTGGTYNITVGSNTVVIFTTSGTLSVYTVTPISVPTNTAKVLVVGGGGSGGGGYEGGGGGGGGYVYDASHAFAVGSYPVTVGAGGGGGNSTIFYDGLNSAIDSLVAQGGGSGAGEGVGGTQPQNGGSGGGGAHPTQTLVGFGTLGQGNNGGVGLTGNPYVGAGGGGANGVGANATTSSGGAGGTGIINPIAGSTAGQLSGGNYYLAGGGGGSLRGGTSGAGGLGGGGTGGATGTAGTANTGGGGGSGQNASNGGISGAGGSGVVVISYPTGSMTTTGGTVTTFGSNTIVTFTSSGTFTVVSIP